MFFFFFFFWWWVGGGEGGGVLAGWWYIYVHQCYFATIGLHKLSFRHIMLGIDQLNQHDSVLATLTHVTEHGKGPMDTVSSRLAITEKVMQDLIVAPPHLWQLSLVMRKPVFGVFDQVRHKLAHSATGRGLRFCIWKLQICWSDCADTDMRLCCSHMAKTRFLITRLIYAMVSLRLRVGLAKTGQPP